MTGAESSQPVVVALPEVSERVRELHGIDRTHVFAMGDGRNDIEMLVWAGEHGRGIAMGQAPAEVIAVASEVTGPITENGAAAVLARL